MLVPSDVSWSQLSKTRNRTRAEYQWTQHPGIGRKCCVCPVEAPSCKEGGKAKQRGTGQHARKDRTWQKPLEQRVISARTHRRERGVPHESSHVSKHRCWRRKCPRSHLIHSVPIHAAVWATYFSESMPLQLIFALAFPRLSIPGGDCATAILSNARRLPRHQQWIFTWAWQACVAALFLQGKSSGSVCESATSFLLLHNSPPSPKLSKHTTLHVLLLSTNDHNAQLHSDKHQLFSQLGPARTPTRSLNDCRLENVRWEEGGTRRRRRRRRRTTTNDDDEASFLPPSTAEAATADRREPQFPRKVLSLSHPSSTLDSRK